MNINTKTILASMLLTALFAGTSAIAGDNDHFVDIAASVNTESVVIQKVSLQSPAVESPAVETDYEIEINR